MSGFEWDEEKRTANLDKHRIDFADAAGIFLEPVVDGRSRYPHEERWIAIGLLGHREIAVVYTWRGGVRRIISARRARPNERRAYHEAYPR